MEPLSMRPLTYSSYLHVGDLLSLQHRLTAAHDELQFIAIHQVFELWFKLLLFELETIAARNPERAHEAHAHATDLTGVPTMLLGGDYNVGDVNALILAGRADLCE